MDRFQADAIVRALTGGASPAQDDTLLFSLDKGWYFGNPLAPLAVELDLTVTELIEAIQTLLEP